jgi:hypothetical protein
MLWEILKWIGLGLVAYIVLGILATRQILKAGSWKQYFLTNYKARHHRDEVVFNIFLAWPFVGLWTIAFPGTKWLVKKSYSGLISAIFWKSKKEKAAEFFEEEQKKESGSRAYSFIRKEIWKEKLDGN